MLLALESSTFSIVDYFGVFDGKARALAFDEESVRDVITNFRNLEINYQGGWEHV
jgi:hypothetical protein